MATKPPSLPQLKMPREEARQNLQERIDAAKEIVPGPIQSGEDLRPAEAREKKWLAYNADLLLRMFTTDQYAWEYGSARVHVHHAADRYNDPSLTTLASRLNESLRQQVAVLESVIERLKLLDEVAAVPASPDDSGAETRNKIFVVHGHDHGARDAVARVLDSIGLKAVILSEQPDQGRAIIEKFEHHAGEVGFAVVLLTPDDVGGTAAAAQPSPRARQNVIFELGYFAGKLGRGRTCLMRKGEVEIPSDLYGVIYTDIDAADGWKLKLAKELKAAKFDFDASKVLV